MFEKFKEKIFGGNKEKPEKNDQLDSIKEKQEKNNRIIEEYTVEATKGIDNHIEELIKAAEISSKAFVENRDPQKNEQLQDEMKRGNARVGAAKKQKIDMEYNIKKELNELKDSDPEILKKRIKVFNEKIEELKEKKELNNDDQKKLLSFEEEVNKLETARRLQE